MSNDTMVLFCSCANSDIIADDAKEKIRSCLRDNRIPHIEVNDLCGKAADRDPVLEQLESAGSVSVIACHTRMVKWLLYAAGLDLDDNAVTWYDIRSQAPDDIISGLLGCDSSCSCHAQPDKPWEPWFPVIDYSRCTNCGQCLDFCLFGVYERDNDGKVVVARPRNCKNNCPACARICPTVAIMFPKLDEAPVNGAEVTDELLATAKVRLNMDQITGENLHAALAARKSRAKAKLLKRDDSDNDSSSCGCNGPTETSSTEACGCETPTEPAPSSADCDCDCDCGPATDCCTDCETKCYEDESDKD